MSSFAWVNIPYVLISASLRLYVHIIYIYMYIYIKEYKALFHVA